VGINRSFTMKIILLGLLVLLVACQPRTEYVKVEEKNLNETMDMFRYCADKLKAFEGFFRCNTEKLKIETEFIANENAFFECLNEHKSDFCIMQLATLQTPVNKRLSAQQTECAEYAKRVYETK